MALRADGNPSDSAISVLLVERDPQLAQLLLLLFSAPEAPRRRFDAVRVEDVEEGLRSLARSGRVDAVVLGRSGGKDRPLLRTLRRRAPGVPIVALDGFRAGGRLNSQALMRALSGAVGSRLAAA